MSRPTAAARQARTDPATAPAEAVQPNPDRAASAQVSAIRWAGAATVGRRSRDEVSDLREAAIDLEVGTVDVAGLVRGKERHHIGDLGGKVPVAPGRQ